MFTVNKPLIEPPAKVSLALTPAEKASVFNVYKSSIVNCNYVFRNGTFAHFLNGEYLTNDAVAIAELNDEIKVVGNGFSAHPTFYVDAIEITRDLIRIDPLEEIRAKAIADYIAQQAAATDKSRDGGTTTFSGKLEGIANSTTVAQSTASSDSDGGAGLGTTTPSSDAPTAISAGALSALKAQLAIK